MIMVSKWYLAPQKVIAMCNKRHMGNVVSTSVLMQRHVGNIAPPGFQPPQKSQVLLILNINRMSRLPLKVLRTLKVLLLPSLPEQKFA